MAPQMGLKLDPQSEAARDLAKRAVPPGGQLKLPALLSALYHTSSLKERFPKMASWLEMPRGKTMSAPVVSLSNCIETST